MVSAGIPRQIILVRLDLRIYWKMIQDTELFGQIIGGNIGKLFLLK